MLFYGILTKGNADSRQKSNYTRFQNEGPFCYLGAKAKYLNCKSHPMVQPKKREVTNPSDLGFSKTTRYKNITLREKGQTETGTFCVKR